jgi:hypothetical protein
MKRLITRKTISLQIYLTSPNENSIVCMHESTLKMGYVFFQTFFKFFVFSIVAKTKDNSSSVDNLVKANLWRLNIVANANYI